MMLRKKIEEEANKLAPKIKSSLKEARLLDNIAKNRPTTDGAAFTEDDHIKSVTKAIARSLILITASSHEFGTKKELFDQIESMLEPYVNTAVTVGNSSTNEGHGKPLHQENNLAMRRFSQIIVEDSLPSTIRFNSRVEPNISDSDYETEAKDSDSETEAKDYDSETEAKDYDSDYEAAPKDSNYEAETEADEARISQKTDQIKSILKEHDLVDISTLDPSDLTTLNSLVLSCASAVQNPDFSNKDAQDFIQETLWGFVEELSEKGKGENSLEGIEQGEQLSLTSSIFRHRAHSRRRNPLSVSMSLTRRNTITRNYPLGDDFVDGQASIRTLTPTDNSIVSSLRRERSNTVAATEILTALETGGTKITEEQQAPILAWGELLEDLRLNNFQISEAQGTKILEWAQENPDYLNELLFTYDSYQDFSNDDEIIVDLNQYLDEQGVGVIQKHTLFSDGASAEITPSTEETNLDTSARNSAQNLDETEANRSLKGNAPSTSEVLQERLVIATRKPPSDRLLKNGITPPTDRKALSVDSIHRFDELLIAATIRVVKKEITLTEFQKDDIRRALEALAENNKTLIDEELGNEDPFKSRHARAWVQQSGMNPGFRSSYALGLGHRELTLPAPKAGSDTSRLEIYAQYLSGLYQRHGGPELDPKTVNPKAIAKGIGRAFTEVLNETEWPNIKDRELQAPKIVDWNERHSNTALTATVNLTPAAKFTPVYRALLGANQGVCSRDNQSVRAVNAFRSEMRIKCQNDPQRNIDFVAVTHGSHGPPDIENEQDRLVIARSRVSDIVNITANADPGKLRWNDKEQVYDIDIVSINLETASVIDKGFERMMPHFQALKEANDNAEPYEVMIDKDIAAQHGYQDLPSPIRVKPRFIPFNVGVNLIHRFEQTTKGKITQGSASKQHRAAIEETNRQSKDILIGNEEKPALAGQLPTADKKYAELRSSMQTQVKALYGQGSLWDPGDNSGQDAYAYSARIALLAHLSGAAVNFNCKSGKDRTGQINNAIHHEMIRIATSDDPKQMPSYNTAFNDIDKKSYNYIHEHAGRLEVCDANTGLRGMKSLITVKNQFTPSEYKRANGWASQQVMKRGT